MFRAILIIFILILPFSIKSQTRVFKDSLVLNPHLTKPVSKKTNLILYKYSGFKFTLKPNININSINKAVQNNEENFSFIGYEFRAKYYLSKKVNLIFKTRYSGVNTITSLGVCFLFNR